MTLFFLNRGGYIRALASLVLLIALSVTGAAARTLVIESSPPTGVTVAVSPAGSLGVTQGVTNFSLTYPDATEVTLTAPNQVGRYRFLRWVKNGEAHASSLSTQVILTADQTLRAIYQEVVPVFPTDLRVMPLGDSITYGYNGGNAGYRGPLYSLLNPLVTNFRYQGSSAERPGALPLLPINQRFHEGHSSYNIQDISNNLDGLDTARFLELGGPDRDPRGGHWLTGGNGTGRQPIFPEIITLMAGTNDLNNMTGVEQSLVGLLTKITTLRPDTKLFVARVAPVLSLTTVGEYNGIVSRVVGDFQAAGKKVFLVDLNTGFPSNGLDPDGIHPNSIGFNWMASRWFESIVAAYSPPAVKRPFHAESVALPGQIQAEDYNLGGSGISYSDTSAANEGGVYRPDEGVDIEASQDAGGGYQIFQTQAGEWLEYSVTASQAGGFTPSLRIATESTGAEIYLEVDGANVTDDVTLPNTGGTENWQTITLPEIHLSTGDHILRLGISNVGTGGSAGAINWLNFAATSLDGPSAQAGPDLEAMDANNNGSELVTLSAAGSAAGDSPIQTYTWWRGGAQIASGLSASVTLPVGIQVIQLTVTDANGLKDTDDLLITVKPKSLLNGSFESGFNGWTISGSTQIQTSAPYSPTDGVKLAGFNGGDLAASGILTQSIATAPGGTYTIAFDLGALSFNGSTQTMRVTATGSGNLLTQTLNITGPGGGNNLWLPQSFTFVANTQTTTLSFRDLSSTTVGIDLLLDNIQVTGPSAIPTNTAPVAIGESYTTSENIPLIVAAGGLLANDNDAESNSLVAIPKVLPRNGTLSMNLNGGFTYTPTQGFYGTDFFTYLVNDQFLNSNIVTVSLTVNEVIPAPTATADFYSTNENALLAVPARGVLNNDADLRSRPLTAVLDSEPAHGSLAIEPDGSFIYIPTEGYYGNDSFSYRSNNGFLDSNISTVSLTINEVIPPPIAVADAYVTDENSPLFVPADGVLANDSDPRTRAITAIIDANPQHGSVILNPDGSFTYTPNDFYFGPDSFTYRSNNGFLNSAPVIVNLTINEVVPPPIAVSDFYSTDENRPLSIATSGLLSNDSDLRGRSITALLDAQPAHGTVVIQPSGNFLYTPTTGYYGTDSFTYRATNGFANSAPATVYLNINEIIPTPIGTPDAYVTNENIPLVISASGVLANDSDPRGRRLTARLAGLPVHGSLILNSNGSFTYIPNAGYYGNDSFIYFAKNGFLASGLVIVNLTINEVVPPPVATADFYATDENVPLSIPANGLLSNDFDLRGRTITALIDTQPAHGNVILNPNGSFLYTPTAGYFGSDNFTYRASNGIASSAPTTVHINVSEVIPPPVGVDNTYSTNENLPLVVAASGVLTNDSDPRGRPLTAILATGPTHGALILNSNGSFIYTPDTGYYGSDSFTYFAKNGFLASNLVTVNLAIIEVVPPPVAVANNYVTSENSPLFVPANGVLINDSDPRARSLTAVLKSTTNHGTIILNPDGSFLYTPAAGYFGPDSFTYQANNGVLNSNTSTVSLNVTEVIPPPVAVADSYVTEENEPLTVLPSGVLENDSDPRGRTITPELVTSPSHGNLIFNLDGSFSYTPANGFFGADSFTYRINNGFLNSNVSTVEILVNERIPAPVALADSFTTSENIPLAINASGVLANDSDPRLRPLTAVLESGPSQGNLVLVTNGGFVYTPAANFFGNDSFTYRARNGFINSDAVTVSLVVTEVIPPPIAVADSYVTNENSPLVVPSNGVLSNDTDPRARPLTALIETSPSHGTVTLNLDGSFTYTPLAGYFGADSFTYRANNGTRNSNVVSVSLTIQEVIPAPFAAADTYTTLRGTTLTIPAAGVLANDTDPRSRSLTALLQSTTSQGTLTLNSSGAFTYTPTVGFSGTDTFTYRTRNGFLESSPATVTITVEGINFIGPLNGSFESGFAHWTVTGNAAVESSAPYVPTHGTKLVGFNGADSTPNAVISQTFDTAPGDTYTIAFDVGVLSYNTNSQTMQLSVTGSGSLLTRTITFNGLGNGSNRWQPQSFTFVANSLTTTLTFRDQSASTLNLDMTLDNVRVTGPPTAPTNTAPVATADSYSTNQNTALVVPAAGVLLNDTDAQAQPLTATLSTGPANGTLTLNANGGFTYTPNNGYVGSDSFIYRANDGSLNSNFATVSLTVISTNTAPVAAADSYSTNQNTALVVTAAGVLLNDTDAQAQPLTAILSTGPANGTLTLNANGGFTYTPNNGYVGSDSFTYRANDGSLNSNVATVSLMVISTNIAPVATADSYSTNQNTELVVPAAGVLLNDTDAQAQPLTATLSTGPANGTLTLNANGGFTYTPNNSYVGTDSFTYRANDGSLNSNVATVSITVSAPVAVGLVNGSFESDFNGWTASGAQHIQSTAPYVATAGSKLIGFNGANLTPNAVLSQSFATTPGITYTLEFDLGVLAFNTNSQTMQVAVIGTASLLSRTLTVFGVGGGINHWVPQNFNFVADSSLTTLRFTDQSTSTQGLDMTLDNVRVTDSPQVTNTAPVAIADSFSTNQDTALVVPPSGVLANDTDAQSQPLTAIISNGPAHGSVTLNANGGFTYTPNNGYVGSDSFAYIASDGLLNSNVATVSLTIISTNTAPVAVADSFSTNHNTVLVVPAAGVLANDTDAQAQPLTSNINNSPANGTLTLKADGGFTYTPNNGFTGIDSFTYQANDGTLSSTPVAVNITVSPPIFVGLVNGSFESGFAGWTISGSQIVQSAAPYIPTHGTKLIGFNGANQTPSGVLSQIFDTAPGQTYTLAFDAGVFAFNTNSQTLQVTVNGASNVLTRTINIFGTGGGSNTWQAQSFNFVANSTNTTLTFRDQSSSTLALDLLLDNVRVTAVSMPAPMVAQAIALPPVELGPLTLTGTPGDFTIQMTATQPGTYFLERSDNLTHWKFITETTANQPSQLEFHDTREPLDPQPLEKKMFYRVGRRPSTESE